MRVVIAEDDSIVELGLQRMLKSLGHQVVASARTSEEAVEMVKKSRPHTAILDIEMPERDGLDAAHEITESCPIAILMLTAFSDHSLVKKAAESGAFAYLVKPVTMKQLDAAMGLALARFEDCQRMKKETDCLRQRLEERKLVDRAREILAQYLGISEGEALRRMQAESRRNRRKIEETAKAIIATCEILSRSPTTKA